MRYFWLVALIFLVGCQDKFKEDDYVQLKRKPDVKGFVRCTVEGEYVHVNFNINGVQIRANNVPESELEYVPAETPASTFPDPPIKFFKIPKSDPLYDLLNPPSGGIPKSFLPEDKQA